MARYLTRMTELGKGLDFLIYCVKINVLDEFFPLLTKCIQIGLHVFVEGYTPYPKI